MVSCWVQSLAQMRWLPWLYSQCTGKLTNCEVETKQDEINYWEKAHSAICSDLWYKAAVHAFWICVTYTDSGCSAAPNHAPRERKEQRSTFFYKGRGLTSWLSQHAYIWRHNEMKLSSSHPSLKTSHLLLLLSLPFNPPFFGKKESS